MASAIEETLTSPPAVLAKVRPVMSLPRRPLVLNNRNFHWVTDKICGIVENPAPRWWWVCFIVSVFLASFTAFGLTYLVSTGVGVWGLRSPVFWGWDIVNFVFWIGIGHAGTLISAILCLLRQKWRTAINRSAEAMTIFAVMCAGLFPLFHVGRVWFAWWLLPLPNGNAIWPNFRSPLEWDVFAVSTYFTVSVLFWYMGMVPDLGALRDRATQMWRKYFYGAISLGWRGSTRHWRNYEMAYLILAGLSTPLVLSVHTIVSFDFASAVLPGWHTTIFPPYFVAGAIFSGFGMVLTLVLPLRSMYKLHDLITQYHIDCMCKIILATGSMVGYAYSMEFFISWYSGNIYEVFTFINRAFGQYAWAYWIMISCNVISPQLFWFRWVRENTALVFIITLFVNCGMWFERFVITATSLANDFVPTSWAYYTPSTTDMFTFFGTFGFFGALFLLFVRFLPMLPIAEIKHVMKEADPHYNPDGDDHHHAPAAVKGGRS